MQKEVLFGILRAYSLKISVFGVKLAADISGIR